MNNVLEFRGVRKEYPGTVALEDFSAGFAGGKVHALVGKNGSGKSTTIKILSGAVAPTRGELFLEGNPVEIQSPRDALEKGIATVYQELSLIRELSIAENIAAGRLPTRGRVVPRVDWETVRRRAEETLATLGVTLPLEAPVRSLSVGQQQIVEIAKAMSFDPRILILDEPTSALAAHEVDNLFEIVRRLRDRGVTVIYISHRLQELHQIADTVTVLRDGKHVGTIGIGEASTERVVGMMFGEVVTSARPHTEPGEEPVLRVEGLTRQGWFRDVSFVLHRGEILGIAGMLGAGRTELLRSIYGADPVDGGTVHLGELQTSKPSLRKMKQQGLGLTPENRKDEGLIQIHTVHENLIMAALRRISPTGIRNRPGERAAVQEQIDRLSITLSSPDATMSSLSGGNQQKVVIGNWLNDDPEVLFFDEPSRGIDVAAKQHIFRIIWDLSAEGISSIFVSTELEELLEVCHRILIMRNGVIAEEVDPEQISLKELYARCMEE
ncbi:MAG: sugar ABC transporter ATP-binding protein [Alkalispirochaetaceae bacterium]